MKKAKNLKTITFYGESTAKDAPVFLLAQALGVWGKPQHQQVIKSSDTQQFPQGDLFNGW